MKMSKRICNISLLFFSFLFLQFQQKTIYRLRNCFLGGSNITITINATGYQLIFYNNCTTIDECGWDYPNRIYLNGNLTNTSEPYIILTEKGTKTIILEWENKLNSTNNMFLDCINIIEIDLSQFDSSSVTRMSAMFKNCHSLTSIDFSNFDTSSLMAIGSMFYNCYNLISLDLSNFNTNNLVYSNQVFYNCRNLVSLDLSNFETTKVITFGDIFYNCSSLISINFQNLNMTQANNTNNMFYNCENLNYLNLKNYEEKSDLDYNNIFNGTTNLTICFNENNNPSLANFSKHSNKINITDDCFDFNEKFNTSIIDIETKDAKFEYNLTNCTCNENCNIDYLLAIAYHCKTITFSENKILKLSDIIISGISSGKVQKYLKEKNSIIFSNENNIHQLSKYSYQEDNSNLTSLNLDSCKDAITSNMSLANMEDLYLYIIEHNIEGINIPILEYILFTEEDIYQNIFINLTICGDSQVKIQVHPKIGDKDIDEYDPTSDVYNNNCKKKSENGVDLTVYDRKNRYNDKNMSLCEKDCEFIQYNTTINKVECDCVIKIDLNLDINNSNIGELVSKIENNKKSRSNLDVMQCDVLSSKENIITNTGFFLLLFILVIFIIVFIIFCIKGKDNLEKQIDEVIYNHFEKKKEEKNDNNNSNKSPNNKLINKTKKSINQLNLKKNITQELKLKSKENTKSINVKNKTKNNNRKTTGQKIINNSSSTKNNIINAKKNKKNKKNPKMNDYELNILSYMDAITFDKRTSCDYYCALIKNKQLFMFTFCSFTDYNSKVIKRFIFFLSFALHYTINALWFNDSTMHQIYQDEGSYNFSYQCLSIFVSALAATVILRIMLEVLVLTERSIVKLKLCNSYEEAMEMKTTLMKNYNIKFAIFFVINFLLLVAFWYYLTCFNAIYSNTQVYLIDNTLISFAISLFFPVIYNIIPTVLRILALNKEKKDGEGLYIASQIFQII